MEPMRSGWHLSLVLKEVLHQLAALVLQNATSDGALGVQGMRGILMITALLVAAAIDHAGQLCPAQGSGTHRARLYGDVKRAVGQVLPAQLVGRRRDGLHLSMGRHVVQRLCQVVGTGDDAVLAYDDGTNGYLSFIEGLLRLLQCAAHILFVFLWLFHCAKLGINGRTAKEKQVFL